MEKNIEQDSIKIIQKRSEVIRKRLFDKTTQRNDSYLRRRSDGGEV